MALHHDLNSRALTEVAFNVTAASNITSPYNASSVVYGLNNRNHTSTIALVYSPRTLPTPWPFVLGGFCLSLVTASWGYSKNRQKLRKQEIVYSRGFHLEPESWKFFPTVLTIVTVAIATIRSFSAFIQVTRTLHGGYAHLAAISALLDLGLSNFPFITGQAFPYSTRKQKVSLNAVVAILAFVNMFLCVIAAFIMTASVVHRGHSYYSKWFVSGGNCPLFVEKCQELQYVGCGLDTISGPDGIQYRDPNILHSANYLRLEGFIEAIWIFAIMGICTLAMGIVFISLCFTICGHEKSTDQSSIAPPAPIIAPASSNHDRPETRN